MGRRRGCVSWKSWPAPASSWLFCMEVHGVNCGSSKFCRHTAACPKLTPKSKHFQDWLLHISVSLSNVLLGTLDAVGPILGCQLPHCGSAVGALAHLILRAFWLPFHSLPFTCSFVPFLLRCHRNVSQHFWEVSSVVSCSHYCCSHAATLMALKLATLYFSLGEKVLLGWDSCPPLLFLLGVSYNYIPQK